ncbi:FkbM family methyltransferase [bacterium]|nr:FkbM family methyltransferase [bacterium]
MKLKFIQTFIDIIRGKTSVVPAVCNFLGWECAKRDKNIPYIRTFSQSGEDAIVRTLFSWKNKYVKSYLDIGACCIKASNTYMFYNYGIRGVLVEANKDFIKDLKKYRPNDNILNFAVTPDENAEFVDFYEDTISSEEAKIRKQKLTARVEAKTINKIINENFQDYPDLLSIDIEGVDLEVLKTLDFNKYPIPVIIVETVDYSENHIKNKITEIPEYLNSKGYFSYADTYINTIFVNKNWFYN